MEAWLGRGKAEKVLRERRNGGGSWARRVGLSCAMHPVVILRASMRSREGRGERESCARVEPSPLFHPPFVRLARNSLAASI